jgi:hypothetical protein
MACYHAILYALLGDHHDHWPHVCFISAHLFKTRYLDFPQSRLQNHSGIVTPSSTSDHENHLRLAMSRLWGIASSSNASRKQPNFLFILTDDQDLHMQSIEYMPLPKKHIASKGTTHAKHYCTVSICCPSRVNLRTGLAAHNNNVTDVKPPYGGYPKFVREGLNEKWLPV